MKAGRVGLICSAGFQKRSDGGFHHEVFEYLHVS
jgi:hypothetical protein